MGKRIFAIIGARPQFIKHAPVELAFQAKNIDILSIHTGQHYDAKMSEVFFDQLKMQRPFASLEIGSHPHGKQTALMMMALEEIFAKEKPDAVLVYGDTNSTLAGALVASKMHLPLIHIEAGLRSFNKSMPEEINRVLTDHVSDLLLVPTEEAVRNLKQEGITRGVSVTGDVMVDSFLLASQVVENDPGMNNGSDYFLATLHRPYNTDERERLAYVLESLNQLDFPVVFPMHPRTRNLSKEFGINLSDFKHIDIIEPIGFFDSIRYLIQSKGLITDSGGMQKEAYLAKKRCVTIRTETEWVETVQSGWNTLLFEDLSDLNAKLKSPLPHEHPDFYGDGKAAERMANEVIAFLT